MINLFKYKTDNDLNLEYSETMFPESPPNNKASQEELIQKAYDIALQIRNFEIELFWKRAQFFWIFLSALFIGYFYAFTTKNDIIGSSGGFSSYRPYLLHSITVIGILFSYIWMQAIKASAFWQENWENHIYHLEKNITGDLFKTICYTGKREFLSIKNLVTAISHIFLAIWIILFFITSIITSTANDNFYSFFILKLIITFCGILYINQISASSVSKKNRYNH